MVGNVYGCMKLFNFQEILAMSLLFIIAYCNISVVVQYSLIYLSLLGQTRGTKWLTYTLPDTSCPFHHRRVGHWFFHWNWVAPWKNRISSTAMKLRKSLVKPVMRQNISSCLVLPPEIVMYDALMLFSERPAIYALLCMTISGGRTELLDIIAGFLPRHWLYEWFSSTEKVRRYMHHAWRPRVEEPNNTL